MSAWTLRSSLELPVARFSQALDPEAELYTEINSALAALERSVLADMPVWPNRKRGKPSKKQWSQRSYVNKVGYLRNKVNMLKEEVKELTQARASEKRGRTSSSFYV